MARLRGLCRPAGVSAAGSVWAGEAAGGKVHFHHGLLLGSGAVRNDGGKELWRTDGGKIAVGSL